MEHTSLKPIASLPVICPLCLQSISLEQLCAHLEMHQRAEIAADILALSRR